MKEKSYLFGKCCMCVLQEDYLIPWKAVLISVYNDLVRKVRLALFYKWEKKKITCPGEWLWRTKLKQKCRPISPRALHHFTSLCQGNFPCTRWERVWFLSSVCTSNEHSKVVMSSSSIWWSLWVNLDFLKEKLIVCLLITY